MDFRARGDAVLACSRKEVISRWRLLMIRLQSSVGVYELLKEEEMKKENEGTVREWATLLAIQSVLL